MPLTGRPTIFPFTEEPKAQGGWGKGPHSAALRQHRQFGLCWHQVCILPSSLQASQREYTPSLYWKSEEHGSGTKQMLQPQRKCDNDHSYNHWEVTASQASALPLHKMPTVTLFLMSMVQLASPFHTQSDCAGKNQELQPWSHRGWNRDSNLEILPLRWQPLFKSSSCHP